MVLTGHDFHSHDYPLLIHVVSGAVEMHVRRCSADSGSGVLVGAAGCVEPRSGSAAAEHLGLSAGSSLWLASGVEHAVTASRDCIMLGPRLSPRTEPPDGLLHLRHSSAIREIALLILASPPACEADRRPFRAALDAELMALIADDFYIPTPTHPIVVSVADDPLSLLTSLPTLVDRHAVSTRHLERQFKDDLGMSFVQWRTRRRLNRALMRIRAGATTPSAARSVGYSGSDGLVKAAGRITGLPRAVLTKSLATAIRDWREPPESFEAAAARSDSRATAAASSRT